jgi:Transcriptional regulatory protein, C terminal
MLYFIRGGFPWRLPCINSAPSGSIVAGLSSSGTVVLQLERKPMELLILLVESDGQLVTRTEIAGRLWSSEVFVDTEHGINIAVRKVRQALDDPGSPRWVTARIRRVSSGKIRLRRFSGTNPLKIPEPMLDECVALLTAAESP